MNDRLVPTLPSEVYLSDQVWRDERDRIWHGQWVLVGRDHDLPDAGDYLVVDVAGESLVVTRDDRGALRGYYNLCRHRGAELVDSTGPACGSFGSVIRCPYHAWTYGLDGQLRRAPFLDHDDTPSIGLHEIAVEAWGGFVFVSLTADSPTLAGQIGAAADRVRRYPLAELRRGLTLTYEVVANWKLIAENYNECYHCGPVHPTLCDLVPEFRRGGAGLEWPDGIPHRPGAWTFTVTGTSDRTPFHDLDDAERVRHKGELIYPNLMLSLSAEHVAAFRLVPHGPSRTTVVCDLLFHPDELSKPSFDPHDASDLWDTVNREDWAICESVQRGMSSRAWNGGWFAPMEDDSVDITRWYRAAMGEPA